MKLVLWIRIRGKIIPDPKKFVVKLFRKTEKFDNFSTKMLNKKYKFLFTKKKFPPKRLIYSVTMCNLKHL